jgi:hypothetical protein
VVLEAFGMQWHTYHLCCNSCGKDFSDGSKVEEGEDNFAYCSECFVTAFSTICAQCNDVIDGEVINAMDLAFHPEHFVCHQCQCRLDAFFPGPDGFPYCEKHYYDSQGKPIVAILFLINKKVYCFGFFFFFCVFSNIFYIKAIHFW